MKKEEAELLASFSAAELAQLEAFIERSATLKGRMTPLEAIGVLARLSLPAIGREIQGEAELAAWEKRHPAPETLVDIPLDEEQLAQIDALIEEHATPTHRLTREAMLELLLERGRQEVAAGASLLPHLELATDVDEETTKY